MDKIFTGDDRAKELGFASYRNLLDELASRAGFTVDHKGLGKKPVAARVDFGRWIADCECGGASYVDPKDPVFFCTMCGNLLDGHKMRMVIFPNNYAAIEEELMRREVVVKSLKLPRTQASMSAIPRVPGLQRSWSPGETVEDLRVEREALEAIS